MPIDDEGIEAKDSKKDLWSKVKGGPTLTSKPKRAQPTWGEKILYYLAECQYQQGKFYAANDSFEKLLNTYTGSPHKDKAVEREFAIAEAWFAAGEDASATKGPLVVAVEKDKGEGPAKDKDVKNKEKSAGKDAEAKTDQIPALDVE